MAMNRIFLGLGSNLGDREHNLARAVCCLAKVPGIQIRQRSSLYESAPIGPEQPDYLNAVIEIETSIPPVQLLALCKEIERAVGRTPGPRWGPRVLDIDLLLCDEIIADPRLQVPHLELHKRAFALMPLCEIAPDAIHPVLGRNIKQLADHLPEDQVVRRIGDFYVDH